MGRTRLPDTRPAIVHKFRVGELEGFINVGLFENGQPGELFITISKNGSTIGGMMDSLAAAVSIALQHGVPIESLVNKLAWQRFEPSGHTGDPEIPFAYSVPDFVFKWLGLRFVHGYKEKLAKDIAKNTDGHGFLA